MPYRIRACWFWFCLAILSSVVLVQPAFGQVATVSNAIPNPMFVNIYWDASWQADTGIPESSIDSFVSALTNSTYFFGMSQYGVNGGTFSPQSFQAAASCGATSPNTITLLTILAFIDCEVKQGIPAGQNNIVYNIFIAPGATETDTITTATLLPTPLGSFAIVDGALLLPLPVPLPVPAPVISFSSCKKYDSYHFHGVNGGPVFTAIFANPQCLSPSGFAGLTANLTHEMIEATTDPFPPITVLITGNGEIADNCENGQTKPKPPLGRNSPFLNPFRGGLTANYELNSSQICVTGFSPSFTPSPAPVNAIQFSLDSSVSPPVPSVTINGMGFGTLPPGFTPTSSLSPYFALTDTTTTPNTESGNSIADDATGLEYGLWSATSIVVDAPNLISGDSITPTVCNPAGGMCSTIGSATVPPFITSIMPGQGPAAGGTTVAIAGQGFSTTPGDTTFQFGGNIAPTTNVHCTSAQSCTAESPIASQGGPYVVNVTTTVTGISGSATSPTSTADLFTYTAPEISWISPTLGPVSGGTPVKITGDGFSSTNTSIDFMNAAGTNTMCGALNCTTVSPMSPIGVGTVDVTAVVQGLSSDPGGPGHNFLYYIDWSPVLNPISSCGHPFSPGADAAVYDALEPVQTPQQIQFTFTPVQNGVPQPQLASMQTLATQNGVAVAWPTSGGIYSVTASNQSVTSPASAAMTINAVRPVCPEPIGATDYSGFGGWRGGTVPIIVRGCGGTPCPGPLQPVIWKKQLGVDPDSSVVLIMNTKDPEEAASGVNLSVDSPEQSSATFRRASGVEVISGGSLSARSAFFAGPVVEFRAKTQALHLAGVGSDADLPERSLQLTIPFDMQGIPSDAMVGLFWLKKQSNREVWTNAGVRILSITRETVTAEIPQAGNFTVVAFEARPDVASATPHK